MATINGAVGGGIGTGIQISGDSTRRYISGFMPGASTLSIALRIPTGLLLTNSGPSRSDRVVSSGGHLTGFCFSSSSIRSFTAESAAEQVQPHSSAQGIENLVIVGSGPAGYTAAIYAARANLKPVVFEGFQVGGVPGGQLMTTTEVENFPGFPDGITGPDLMDRMRRQAERWGGELFQEDVEFIDVKNTPFTVQSSERKIKCHSLIVATGARAQRLRLPREDEFWSRGISACAICDGASPLFKGQVLAVVGGGDTATEEPCPFTCQERPTKGIKGNARQLTVQETSSERLKRRMDELTPLLEHGPLGEAMKIDGKVSEAAGQLLYLYVDCPTMMLCFMGKYMPYNCIGGALLTDLPPYQADVSEEEVRRALREAIDRFGYEDAIRSGYFAAFSFREPLRRLERQLVLASTSGELLTFNLYGRSPGQLKPGEELVSHGVCKFATAG